MTDHQGRLEAALSATGVTGASFAYWDSAKLHTAAAGLRNSVTRDAVTVDTLMHIGSITKVMNAALVMQLVDEGLVGLDDPVIRHLPGLRLAEPVALARMTCAMLIDHTTGIDGDWLPDAGPDRHRIVDLIGRCASLGQLFQPGAAVSYCNVATVIAGHLVETLRGESWYTAIRKRIFEPLGMRHALADVLDVPRFRCSVGDLTQPTTGRSIQTTRAFLSPSFAPAGSTVMATAGDVVTFARGLIAGCVTSPSSALLMAQRRDSFAAPTYGMGLGWMIAPGGILTHSGVGPGVNSVLFADASSGRAMALLTNSDRGASLRTPMLEPILAEWGSDCAVEPAVAPEDPESLFACQGVYESITQWAEVTAPGERLALRLGWKVPLYDTSPTVELVRSRPAVPMRCVGAHSFETQSTIPGAPMIQVRFTQPAADGRMGMMASGFRLLRRTA